jgi:hypothetical protein
MRAHTTIISRRRRKARRRRALALVLAICALAIPASASADPSASGYSRADAIAKGLEESHQSTGGSGGSPYGTGPEYATPNAILGLDGLGEATPVTGSPAGADDGFDFVSAGVGAGAGMALIALGGAALLTVRRRTAISPSRRGLLPGRAHARHLPR